MRGRSESNFLLSNHGGIAVMFGLLMGVLMLCVSLAVDTARLQYVQQRTQQALEAASLAAAKSLDDPAMTTADVQALAETYFRQNLGNDPLHGARLTNFRAVPDTSTGTVQASVNIDLPTLFARAGGAIAAFNTTPSVSANYRTLRIEVSLVLDVTGSMAGPSADGTPKIDSLRRVVQEFIDGLYANGPPPGFVRVALVPYSGWR